MLLIVAGGGSDSGSLDLQQRPPAVIPSHRPDFSGLKVTNPRRAGQKGKELRVICAHNEVQNRQRLEARLRKQARELGLQVVAI
jgi:hypothetical protein